MLPLAQPHSQRRWRKQELRGFGLTARKQEGSLERGWKAEWEVFPGVLSLEVAKEGSGVVGSVLKKVRFYLIFFFFFWGGDGGKIYGHKMQLVREKALLVLLLKTVCLFS